MKYVLSALLISASTFMPGAPLMADDWPQWRGENRDGVWREEGIIDHFPEQGLERQWTAKVGAGYNGPTVAAGRVFCMDRITKPAQQERVLCFDAATGQPLWSHAYDCTYTIGYTAGPRASVTIDKQLAFALGAMGHLHCFDVESGEVIWQRDLNEQFSLGDRMPIWGIAAAPLVFNDLLIVQIGAEDACLVAFEKSSGELRWKSLNDRAQYSAPIIVEQARQPVLVCWTADSIAGLAPATGDVLWRYPFPPVNMPIGVATPIVQDHRLFVTSFYDGSLMLRLDPDQLKVEKVWQKRGENERQTEALHSIISTPIWIGDYIFGVDSYGELRCLEADTGRRVWEDLSATPKARWSTIHFVKHGDRVWMFNERGELIIGQLSSEGFKEIDRTKIIGPTTDQLSDRGGVCWTHPAFANRCVFVRNDEELVCVSLAK